MTRLAVRHETVYRYARPVTFGEHRLMFRPRDSHDLRLVETSLTISPRAEVRWLHDVFSNSIAMASFEEPAEELRFESRILIDHYGLDEPEFQIEPYARTYPFTYPAEESPDLARSIDVAARSTEEVSANIGQVRETSLSAGAAASQVLNSASELEGQAGALKSRVDAFLNHIRAA